MAHARKLSIPNKLYFRIGEVSEIVGVKPYVLRYWETEFGDVRPTKSKSGQRLYKRRDVELLLMVRELLYEHRYTIDGAKQRLRDTMREQRTIGFSGKTTTYTGPRSMSAASHSPEAEAAAQVPAHLQEELPLDDEAIDDYFDDGEAPAPAAKPHSSGVPMPTLAATTALVSSGGRQAAAPPRQEAPPRSRAEEYSQATSARKLLLKLRHDLQAMLQELRG